MSDISEIKQLLNEILDPEIPVISIVELGMIGQIIEKQNKSFVIDVTPTYSGCPALDPIIKLIKEKLDGKGYENYEIKQKLYPAWTTDFMTEETKDKLKRYGIAPPKSASDRKGIEDFSDVKCPRCDSKNTKIINAFSSTACKSLFMCNDCLDPFEYFKCH